MIAKGAARNGPRQLAVYLMRVEEYATGEPAQLLELQSAWASTGDGSRERAAQELIEAFRDWQTLVEGTKYGRDGLYHAQISPEARYARNMTPEQWKRAADILGEELGFKRQDRALILHSIGEDRPHLHVVWARTDIDEMKVIPDSYNYVAHERASKRMELEFGQDFVPGKHAKRDREKQQEFPRAEMSEDEWRQSQRTGLDPRERKKQITALHAASDNAQAFKAALEDAGYLLAKGDSRPFVIIDQAGDIHNLSRQVRMKEAELREYMKDIDREALPTVEEAQTLQKDRVIKLEQPLADQPPPDAELEALKKAWAARKADEDRKLAELHASELVRTESEQETLKRKMFDQFASKQFHEKEALKDRYRKETSGLRGYIAAVKSRWNPEYGSWVVDQRRREFDQFERRQAQERKDYIALLEQSEQLEIGHLKERQGIQLLDHETKAEKELERHVRELETARGLLAEQKELDKQREQESARDGPDPPSRAR